MTRAANAGDAKAQHILAGKYLRGDVVAMNLAASVEWERKSAAQGYAAAQAQLAEDYVKGLGVSEDGESRAESLAQKAAAQGFAKGQRILGLLTLDKVGVHLDRRPLLMPPDWSGLSTRPPSSPPPAVIANGVSTAIDLLQKAATQGDADAEMYLGRIYSDGKLVQRDHAKSIEWFRKAAEQGEAYALWALSVCYASGDGCQKDSAKAAELHQKAWGASDAGGQWAIGDCHIYGNACPKDSAKAIEWYGKAASHGDVALQWQMGYCYGYGGTSGCAKNSAKAAEWYEMAAARGDPYLERRLGECYGGDQFGGCSEDVKKSAEWLQKAADQGDEVAEDLLGNAYRSGLGVIKDAATAAELYEKAATQGNASAQSSLAELYYLGSGVVRNSVLAYAWLDLAAAQTGPNSDHNARIRDGLERLMTQAQIEEAQRLAASWKPGVDLSRTPDGRTGAVTGQVGEHPTSQATGTAFVVDQTGVAVTNEHVVRGCREMRLQGRNGIVKVIATDASNDLALLQLPGHSTASATIAESDKPRQGDDITVFGFPLNGVLASGGNLTTGVISGLTGLHNNTAQFQITAAVQPGSSGSPVMNDHGDVIGIVSSKLSDAALAKASGSVGESVNFAIRGQVLKSFLDANRVGYKTDNGSWFSRKKDPADIADDARNWAVIVECWK